METSCISGRGEKMSKISDELMSDIGEKGYELRSGRIRFPKKLRDRFRAETGDYHSDEIIIIDRMIRLYSRLEG